MPPYWSGQLDLDSGNLHDFHRNQLSTRHIVSLRAGEAGHCRGISGCLYPVTKRPLETFLELDTSSTLNMQSVCPVLFLVSKYGVQKLVYTRCRNKSRLSTKPFPNTQTNDYPTIPFIPFIPFIFHLAFAFWL